MKPFISMAIVASVGTGLFAAGKLTFDDQVELVRGLTAERAKVKAFIPRSSLKSRRRHRVVASRYAKRAPPTRPKMRTSLSSKSLYV